MQRTILVDSHKCVGCYSCVVACKLEHNLPPYPAFPPVGDPQGPALIRIYQVEPQADDETVHRYFRAVCCLHCPDAPCIAACPTAAIYKDWETGITLVDEAECIGCKSCLSVCPYAAPQFYDGVLILCDLCLHRLREGRNTACEAACPAGAIYVGTSEEISAGTQKQPTEGARKQR
jgi:anaerobic dimethyl sulfoxide reductase subunit B (iron-sulfur subunit)